MLVELPNHIMSQDKSIYGTMGAVDAAAIAAYTASNNTPVSFDGGTTPASSDITVAFNTGDNEKALEQIITQKWIALFLGNGWEVYAECRRTDIQNNFQEFNLITLMYQLTRYSQNGVYFF